MKKDFQPSASLIERGGTGGSLFRNIYHSFLAESADLLNSNEIKTTQ